MKPDVALISLPLLCHARYEQEVTRPVVEPKADKYKYAGTWYRPIYQGSSLVFVVAG